LRLAGHLPAVSADASLQVSDEQFAAAFTEFAERRILRSMLMKPEALAHAPALHDRLTRLAASPHRGPGSPAA
jgi:hypothetical protein